MFGDRTGHITFSDRNFHVSEKKHKLFRGEVKGISYLYDPSNHNRQYIVAIGDDSHPSDEDERSSTPLYLIKAPYIFLFFVIVTF